MSFLPIALFVGGSLLIFSVFALLRTPTVKHVGWVVFVVDLGVVCAYLFPARALYAFVLTLILSVPAILDLARLTFREVQLFRSASSFLATRPGLENAGDE